MNFFDAKSSTLLYALGGITAGALSILALRRHFQGGICYHRPNLSGKTAIVTGANTGLGYQTALTLATLNARVILACRNEEKGIESASKIREKSGNGNVIVRKLDLSDLHSVKSFANEILASEDQINYLINNAGVMACPHFKTKQGFEYQLGVNHIGHFLLTNLLLDVIKASSPSRIINVSSKAGITNKAFIDFDDLMFEERKYVPWIAYSQSKLANILFTLQLARNLKGSKVSTNCCHPGVVMTELGRHMDFPLWKKILLAPLILLLFKTPYAGAQTQLYLTLAPEVQDISGYYYADCKRAKVPEDKCYNEKDAERLWDMSMYLVKDYI